MSTDIRRIKCLRTLLSRLPSILGRIDFAVLKRVRLSRLPVVILTIERLSSIKDQIENRSNIFFYESLGLTNPTCFYPI